MEPIKLEPRYSTGSVPGKCIKCLAEHELNVCMVNLLLNYTVDKEIIDRYETIVSFLKADESKILRDEAERYLAEGKQVSVNIYFVDNQPKYKIVVKTKMEENQ